MPGHQLYGGDRFLVLHDVFLLLGMWLVAVGLMDLALTQCNGGGPRIRACLRRQKGSRVPARGLGVVLRKRMRADCRPLLRRVKGTHTDFAKQHRGDFHCKLTRVRRDNKWHTFFATAVRKDRSEGSTPGLSPENRFLQILGEVFWSLFTSERGDTAQHIVTCDVRGR